MQRIRNTVSGPTEPRDTHVFWVDTSNPESPVLKMFNGGWVAVSEPEGGGSGGSEDRVYVQINTSDSGMTEEQMIAFLNPWEGYPPLTSEKLAKLMNGDCPHIFTPGSYGTEYMLSLTWAQDRGSDTHNCVVYTGEIEDNSARIRFEYYSGSGYSVTVNWNQ